MLLLSWYNTACLELGTILQQYCTELSLHLQRVWLDLNVHYGYSEEWYHPAAVLYQVYVIFCIKFMFYLQRLYKVFENVI